MKVSRSVAFPANVSDTSGGYIGAIQFEVLQLRQQSLQIR